MPAVGAKTLPTLNEPALGLLIYACILALSGPTGVKVTFGIAPNCCANVVSITSPMVASLPATIVITPLVSLPSMVAVAPWPAAACGVMVGVLPAVMIWPPMVRLLVRVRSFTVRVPARVRLPVMFRLPVTVRSFRVVGPDTLRLAIVT